MLARIKKDDLVEVVSGKDKKKRGNVIKVDEKNGRLLVKDVCMVTRHMKARKQGEKSKISREESYIPLSIVMPVCSSCKKRCRVQVKSLDGNKKARACHKCKETF